MEMNIADLLFRTPVLFFLFQVALTTSVIHFLQQYLRRDRPENHFIEEFFCVAQTMILSYECGVMRNAYGDLVYALCLFGTAAFYSNIFRQDMFTNPAGTFFSFIADDRMTLVELIGHFFVQVWGSWVAFEYIHAIWSINLIDIVHKEKLAGALVCKSQMTVTVPVGVLVEFLITFFHRFLLRGQRYLSHQAVLAGFANVFCTFAGIYYTGAYFNPSQALIQQYGCEGHGFLDVFTVYVIAPMGAAYIAARYGDIIWEKLKPQPVLASLLPVPSTIL